MTNRIDISPSIKSAISMTDLLKPKGTFKMLPIANSNSNFFDNEGALFIVNGENFHFQLSVDKTGLYVERNGEQCVLTPDTLSNGRLNFFLLTWSPNRLRLITAERIKKADTGETEDKEILVVKHTPPCSVPISLKRWAREKSLIPTKQYESESDFRNAVYQCLSNLKTNVESNGSTEAFWDYSYDGNKIAEKRPKKEVLAQPLIKAIIDTELFIRGIDVFRENTTPAGDIDFTVVGSVTGIGIVNMCIELKNAHSQYLENGLINQLPDYMRSQNSQYGAYLVLNYNTENGNNIQRSELIQKLSLWQMTSNDNLVQTKIRTFVIDLDKEIVANKNK